ncbi:helix-turn-helix domain-containing protein [Paenibacillus sp. IB182496]|uniref:Helix-turn-helix domain-containing protein n=1 Tax=Paenibacillus sabuli TaxID=2772509 RepID=A0A927GUD1_9BACL|nr:helix-turn-helix domain-containing protein [Paenibacillus sabuli]MBD2847577.1 helix-turn-helix domain-containing protein [Paenibacillus sabuli]
MLEIYSSHLDDHIPDWYNLARQVDTHIIALVTEGKVHYRLDGKAVPANKGDLLFIPRGTRREARNDADGTHQKYTVLFGGSLDELPFFGAAAPIVRRTRSFDYFKEKMQLLHRHSIERRPYYETIRSGILTELLATLGRELLTPPVPLRKLSAVRKLEQHILTHFRRAVTLGELARLIDRSPNYTLTVFKEVTGQTPQAYMQSLRISTAMELLQHTDLPVKAISEHLGYYDTSYFYKMFRRATGMSPSAYAKARRREPR